MKKKEAIAVKPIEGCRFNPDAGKKILDKVPGVLVVQNEHRMTIEGPEAKISLLKKRFQILGLDVSEG